MVSAVLSIIMTSSMIVTTSSFSAFAQSNNPSSSSNGGNGGSSTAETGSTNGGNGGHAGKDGVVNNNEHTFLGHFVIKGDTGNLGCSPLDPRC